MTATEGTKVALTNDSTLAACGSVAAAGRENAELSTAEFCLEVVRLDAVLRNKGSRKR
jgi:hypothetical protein